MQSTSDARHLPSSPPRQRTSSAIPRLVTNNADSYRSNRQVSAPPDSPSHGATPNGLTYTKPSRMAQHGLTSPQATTTASRSFDRPGFRSASGPTLKSAASSPTIVRGAKGDKSSFRDLVARFNQNQPHPDPPAITTRRGTSNSEEGRESRYQRRRESQTAAVRPSPLLSSLQSTVDRVNARGETIDLQQTSVSEPRHSSRQSYRPRTTEQLDPDQHRANPPLFGEVVPGQSQYSPGYGISVPQDRRSSHGSMRQPNAMFSHSRSISDSSTPKTPSTVTTFTGGDSKTIYPASPHGRSQSDQRGISGSRSHNAEEFRAEANGDGMQHWYQASSRPATGHSRIPHPNWSGTDGASSEASAGQADKRGSWNGNTWQPTSRPRTPSDSHNKQSLHAIINVPRLATSPPLRSSRPRRDVNEARSVSPEPRTGMYGQSMNDQTLNRSMSVSKDNGVYPPPRTSEDNGTFQALGPGEPQSTLLAPKTYQKPEKGLRLNTSNAPGPSHDDPPSTATTQFEEDSSPFVEMPGSFPSNKPDQGQQTSDKTAEVPDADESLREASAEDLSRRSRIWVSQIMEMRGDSSDAKQSTSRADNRSTTNTEDAGTIQIMLGETPILHQTGSDWYKNERTTAIAQPDAAAPAILEPSSNKRTSSQSLVSHSRSDGDSGSQLSPDTDYAPINRILDQYHQSGVLSPDMVHEFQQYLLDVEPELLGQENTESVARAALEDIIRDSNLHRQDSASSSEPPHSAAPSSLAESARVSGDASRSDTASAAPPPPPKDVYLRPNQSQAPTSAPTQMMQQTSGGATGSLGPFLPETPSTGGSIGFSTTTPPGLHSRWNPPERDRAELQVSAPNGYTQVNDRENAPFVVANADDEATPIADGRHRSSLAENATSTPASSIHDKPSLSESYQTPSSKTSVVEGSVADKSPSSQADAAAPSIDENQRRLNKRRQIVKELLDTEASYHQDMKVVEDIYRATSHSCDAVTNDDRRILFGNSGEIVRFSERFVAALKRASVAIYVMPRSTKWSQNSGSFDTSSNSSGIEETPQAVEVSTEEKDRQTTIGQVFNERMSTMEEIYMQYLRNHDFANQRLKRLQESSKVKLWLHECQNYASDITSAWDLDSLIVKPVQRILKYPLLLRSLLETTPPTHPDYAALKKAEQDVTQTSLRINEAKKRAEVLEQVMKSGRRGRDFDISKLVGRRTDKLRQQVGLSDAVDDTEYRKVAQKFETKYVHLQIVMRDFEKYRSETDNYMGQILRLVGIIEEIVSISHTSRPELESKWRKIVMTFRDMHRIGWTDHEAALTKHCIEPMVTVIRLYDGPQKMMAKRKKRTVEYAKYITAKNKGERIDKRTLEQGEQFMALNETLRDELPKLFVLSDKLIWSCVQNFVELQMQWYTLWQRKAIAALDDQQAPQSIAEIVETFNTDYNYTEAQVHALGIINGAYLAEVSNFLSSSGASFSTGSTARPSMQKSSRSTGNHSPRIPAPDFDRRSGSSFQLPSFSARTSSESQNRLRPSQSQASTLFQQRSRADSNISNDSRHAPQAPRQEVNKLAPYVPHQESRQQRSWEARPQEARPQDYYQRPPQVIPDPQPVIPTSQPQPPFQPQSFTQLSSAQRPVSNSTFYSAPQVPQIMSPGLPHDRRVSSAFSSAMPLSDSPATSRPHSPDASAGQREIQTLFNAASLYDFNLRSDRAEAGYPYLYYTPGEIFDIIGVKGELWLAKNQDDPTQRIGWVWEKHFAKLVQDVE